MKRIGFSKTFRTTQSDLLQHNNKVYALIRQLTKEEVDADDVGNMYLIVLETGEEIQVFEDEISEYEVVK